MENPPLVSVIVQTFNSAQVVGETLESILRQSYSNIEIIICDDGSTDGTQEILQKYQKKHPSLIKLTCNTKNLGITRTSNIALAACTGKYIAFIGGDDIFEVEKLKTQVEYMEQNPQISVSYHDVDVFDVRSQSSLYLYSSRIRPRIGNASTVIRHSCFFCSCSTMLRADKIPAGGYEEFLLVASDWHLIINVLLQGGEIGYIDQVLGKYRRHDNNVTNENSLLRLQGRLDTLNVFHWLLLKYPQNKSDAFYWYAREWSAFRKNKNLNCYLRCLLISLSFQFNFKAFIGLWVFIMTLGFVKL